MNESGSKWTPELKIQAFKEGVTALMGLAVVIFTLFLAWKSLTYSANDMQMANAKDILLLVLGLTGVVIGYYFGRIPADARATQANEKAQQVTAEAAVAADELDGILAEAGGNAAGGATGRGTGQDGTAVVEDVRRVRDNLRSLSRR